MGGFFRRDQFQRRASRLGLQLDFAGAFQRNEPPSGLVDAVTPDAEQPVVLVDGDLSVAEGVGDAVAGPFSTTTAPASSVITA